MEKLFLQNYICIFSKQKKLTREIKKAKILGLIIKWKLFY